jgi:hypothetical protein
MPHNGLVNLGKIFTSVRVELLNLLCNFLSCGPKVFYLKIA